MRPWIEEQYANPSSLHGLGRAARRALEQARMEVAGFLRTRSNQVIFTSGGTESLNLAISSALLNPAIEQVVVSSVEHTSVFDAVRRWAKHLPVVSVPVNAAGQLDVDQLRATVQERKSFVCLMLANNETGVLFDFQTASTICREHGAVLHCDAIAAAGKVAIDTAALDASSISLSAHKFHGPKGCGILYIRHPDGVHPIMPGHQEGRLRGGTENLASIMGCAAAIRTISSSTDEHTHMAALRGLLEQGIKANCSGAAINGAGERLPNTSSVYFPDHSAADMVQRLSRKGICVSAGAACSTGGKPSHVLLAMGLGEKCANASLRFSLSRFTTREEIHGVLKALSEILAATPSKASQARHGN
jgi:cysteine desulfurase